MIKQKRAIAHKGKLEFELDRFLTSYGAVIFDINRRYPLIGSPERYHILDGAHKSGLKALMRIVANYGHTLIVCDQESENNNFLEERHVEKQDFE